MTDIVRPHPDGAVVAVRAVPGSGAAGVQGRHGDELRVKVCSPPVDGRANDELCEVLATVLGVRRREVEVIGGHTSKSKRVFVALSVEDTHARLQAWIGPNEPAGG